MDIIKCSIFGKNSSSAWGIDDDSELLGLEQKDLEEETDKVLEDFLS